MKIVSGIGTATLFVVFMVTYLYFHQPVLVALIFADMAAMVAIWISTCVMDLYGYGYY